MPRVRSGATAALLAAGLTLALPVGGGSAGAAPRAIGACPSAHAVPATVASAQRSARSLLCLLNRERAAAGLRTLRLDRCLGLAARRHARDMVARRYFSHTTPGGRVMTQRVLATGYAPPGASWLVGENLAWGVEPAGDPLWVLRAWLRSATHRANVLRAAFRDVGVAAVPGAPVRLRGAAGLPRATYAVEFGVHGPGRTRC